MISSASLSTLQFQSHAGSIEALLVDAGGRNIGRFQSHAGSIEAQPKGSTIATFRRVSIPRWFD